MDVLTKGEALLMLKWFDRKVIIVCWFIVAIYGSSVWENVH